jgi:hypothetical protein
MEDMEERENKKEEQIEDNRARKEDQRHLNIASPLLLLQAS